MFRPIAPFTAALLAALGLAACTPAPSPAVPELRTQFKPGYPLGEAVKALKARNTTFSVMSAAECETMARQSALAAELRPRGGPCIYGKIPVSKNWLGGRTDVILQLVFAADSTLVDGNFEEISTAVGWQP
ncbi:hypothetical protein [Zoogloea sp.]|uniref:hypothetical protein n=1 Tax=Zoogloea sp. TaxID=49181 RepID=UPI0035ADA739